MASAIIELGFVNSKKDNQLFDENLESYAAAIADGILDTWQLIQSGAIVEEEEETLPTRAITEEGSTDSEGNITSIHLENEQIDEDKDTTLLEWGQGRNFDALNRPGGCLMYQQKYGDESAYFLGPWEEGEDKVIYLTFDIGYTNESTTKILDTLKEKDVKAVFFATLPVLEDDDEIVNRIIDEGHELGNHSATHPSAGIPSKSVEEQREEVMKGHNLALEKYNYEMHLFRFPAGKFSEQSLAIVNNCNYRSVFWSYAHQDWNVDNQPDVSTSLQAAVERLHPGAIYLLHGISSTNAAMLGDLIDQAREQGYTFGLLQ
jgi:delta-lactam-biosynthetic de-N-acetylase